jgi:hypothetical protein
MEMCLGKAKKSTSSATTTKGQLTADDFQALISELTANLERSLSTPTLQWYCRRSVTIARSKLGVVAPERTLGYGFGGACPSKRDSAPVIS